MKWTREQESIIKARGSNLLVSAAAGSGKTAVLVARIIGRITDEAQPLSLDRLLVMTFTRAAAEELRERIGKALRERLASDPDNRFLQLQKAILPRAQITTIDGFCQFLIRQQYQALDIDPGFRVGDEGELSLLRSDLLKALTEEAYDEGDAAFLRFADAYGGNRLDTKLSTLIEQIHAFIQAAPWPERFLASQQADCRLEAEGRLSETSWMRQLLKEMHLSGADFEKRLQETKALCEETDGPAPYLPAVEVLLAAAEALTEVDSYEALYEILSGFESPKLKAVRGKAVDPEKKTAAKAIIDAARKFFDAAQANYACLSKELLLEASRGSAEAVGELLTLAGSFMRRYEVAKREKNIVDFSDMEHLALRLLYQESAGQTGTSSDLQLSPLADQLAQSFDEILIDEYQDSNGLQEALLTALSAERFGRPDVFMVGDVKQSIYRFRLAEPQLFMEKYDSYQAEGPHRKIELAQNFRSRASVLASVNDVFFPLMQRSVGGIDYNRQTALHAGATYPQHASCKTELDLISLNGIDADEPEAEETAAEARAKIKTETKTGTETEIASEPQDSKDAYEARWIAQRILTLVHPEAPEQAFLVTDGKTGELRPARYSDIVILLRAPGNRVEQLVDSLGAFGIPAYAETRTGYFKAIEVEVVVACLNIIDNPHQDIALAAVLKSPIGGFSDADLAEIRAAFCCYAEGKVLPLTDLYEALNYAASSEDAQISSDLAGRSQRFLAWLARFRSLSDALPVYRLLHQLYLETGYYDLVSAMTLGDMRRKNLDMLLQQAETYASTSYQGLFNFVRYVEKLKQHNTDYGEAQTVSEQDDIVRITSIHKSKGLEYPIVILAGLGRQFNKEDLKDSIVIDSQLGLGADYIDGARRLRFPGLKKAVIRAKRLRDNYGEELRVLYVAMTRAKEKLIMTAAVQNAVQKLEKYAASSDAFGALLEAQQSGAELSDRAEQLSEKVPQSSLLEASSYLDWLLLSGAAAKGSVQLRLIGPDDIADTEIEAAVQELETYQELTALNPQETPDPDYERELARALSAAYPHPEETRLKPKVSVSELKRAEAVFRPSAKDSGLVFDRDSSPEDIDYDDGAVHEQQAEQQPTEWKRAAGPQAGTAFHRVMELLDFAALRDVLQKAAKAGMQTNRKPLFMEQADGQLQFAALEQSHCFSEPIAQFLTAELARMKQEGRLPAEEAKLLNPAEIGQFLESPLAAELAEAAGGGRLWREQHFMIGLPARELTHGATSGELQLLQGIIDAYLIDETGKLVLVDYKTDRVQTAEMLKARYAIQLGLYARALRQLTGRSISRTLLYSTKLGRAIEVETEA